MWNIPNGADVARSGDRKKQSEELTQERPHEGEMEGGRIDLAAVPLFAQSGHKLRPTCKQIKIIDRKRVSRRPFIAQCKRKPKKRQPTQTGSREFWASGKYSRIQ